AHDIQPEPWCRWQRQRQRAYGRVYAVALRQCAVIHQDEWLVIARVVGWPRAAACAGEKLGISAIQYGRQLVLRRAARQQQLFKGPAHRHDMIGERDGEPLLPRGETFEQRALLAVRLGRHQLWADILYIEDDLCPA